MLVRGRDREKREREEARKETKKERKSRKISGWWTGYETEAYEVSIPPKYGRVYTRINGRVSCKAITFPFLRFRCAHERKGASLRIRERKMEGGQTAWEKGRKREREIERKKRKRQKAEMTRIERDHEGRILYVQIVCTRAISYASQRILLQSNDLTNIYNSRLLIVSPLIALRMSLYVRS